MNAAMLPATDPSDSSETRWALETARTLWGQGERREALQWVRRAAEAAAESGQDDRALLLAKQGAELRNSLEIPRTLPPPAPRGQAASAPGETDGVPPAAAAPHQAAAPSSASPSSSAKPVLAPPSSYSTQPTAKSVAPAHVPSVGPSSGPSISVHPTSMPPLSSKSVAPPGTPEEVVVTIVMNDGTIPTPDASLVSRRAVRVAVIAVDSPTELRVKKLAPGEVAPADSTVALLVAFEAGSAPIPEG